LVDDVLEVDFCKHLHKSSDFITIGDLLTRWIYIRYSCRQLYS